MVEYNKVSLTPAEEEIFEGEWDLMWTRHFKAREVIDVYQDHKAVIKEACQIAKYQLEQPFGGADARTNQFGWMPIMPSTLLATTTPTYSTYTWNRYITTANVTSRWIDWIGTSDSNLKLSKYATMVIIGFADPVDEPKIGAILAKVKGVDYPIRYFADQIQGSDYPVVELTSPIIVEKEQEFYLQVHPIQAGLDKLRPLGVYFAKGDHMRTKDLYAQT